MPSTSATGPADPKKPPAKGFIAAYRRWARRWGPPVLIIALLAIGVGIIFFDRVFIFIRSGQQGVLWYRLFGTDLQHHYEEGMTVIFPWDDMYIYDVRAQQVADEFTVLSRDGLAITVEVSIRYRPQVDRLPLLHVEIGPDYVEKVVKPEVRAKVRYLLGQYLPDEIYSSQGLLVRRTVEEAAPELAQRYITLEDLLIKTITLPRPVQEAIESKLQQEQAFLAYEFRLQREEQEKERKRIEAEGIQQFQRLIESNGSSFDKYLTYLGIQATLALAKSENAKVVVIGGGEQGLPLILNMPDSGIVAGGNSGNSASATARPIPSPAQAGSESTVDFPIPEINSQAVEPDPGGPRFGSNGN